MGNDLGANLKESRGPIRGTSVDDPTVASTRDPKPNRIGIYTPYK